MAAVANCLVDDKQGITFRLSSLPVVCVRIVLAGVALFKEGAEAVDENFVGFARTCRFVRHCLDQNVRSTSERNQILHSRVVQRNLNDAKDLSRSFRSFEAIFCKRRLYVGLCIALSITIFIALSNIKPNFWLESASLTLAGSHSWGHLPSLGECRS